MQTVFRYEISESCFFILVPFLDSSLLFMGYIFPLADARVDLGVAMTVHCHNGLGSYFMYHEGVRF